MRSKHVRLFLFCLVSTGLIWTAWAGSAFAHRVSIFAYIEDGMIHTESYFPDGKPTVGATVSVLDSENQKVGEGVTDAEGKCVLPIPKKDDLTLVLEASMGHRATYLLKKSDLGD